MGTEAIARHLATHDGVITQQRAVQLGLTAGQIGYRLRSGVWQSRGRGVYLSAEHEFGDRAAVRVAVLQHRGVADRSTAAWWHGMAERAPQPITVSSTVRRHRAAGTGVSVTRRTFPQEDLDWVDGLALTAPPLTVLLAAADLHEPVTFLDRMLQTRRVTVGELTAALERCRGMAGFGSVRRLVEVAAQDSESAAERRYATLLRRERIDGWVQQYPFRGFRLDFAFPAERIGIEIHGWAFHRERGRFEADQRKTNALVSAGWLPLIYTWDRIVGEPGECMREVAHALAVRRAEL